MYLSRYNQETGETEIQDQNYTVENNIANIDIGTLEANGNVYLNMVVQTTGTEMNPILHQFSIQGNNVPVSYTHLCSCIMSFFITRISFWVFCSGFCFIFSHF